MSNGDIRRVSLQDIQLVQNLIERCLQLYMTQAEVASTLLHQAKIEPGFTELAYQAPQPTGFSIKPEGIHQTMSVMPNLYTNGTTTLQPCMQVAVDMMGHSGRIDVPANSLLAQNSNTVMMQGMNGGMIKLEPGYAGNSSCIFGADSNLLDHGETIGEGSVPSFVGAESSSHMLNETMLDPETNSFGFLGQIPRNFSFSDLAADFSHSTDILETYAKSPFLGTDANFLDPRFREDQQGDPFPPWIRRF